MHYVRIAKQFSVHVFMKNGYCLVRGRLFLFYIFVKVFKNIYCHSKTPRFKIVRLCTIHSNYIKTGKYLFLFYFTFYPKLWSRDGRIFCFLSIAGKCSHRNVKLKMKTHSKGAPKPRSTCIYVVKLL